MSGARSLAQVLDDDAWRDGRNHLLHYVRGRMDADDLSLDDWVRPLKMTGGQVCLRWRDTLNDRAGYVYVEDGKLVYQFAHGDEGYDGDDALDCLKYDLQSQYVKLIPVLRGRTSLGEQ